MSDSEDYDNHVSDREQYSGSEDGEGEDLFEQGLWKNDHRHDDRLDNYDEALLGDSDEEEVQPGMHHALMQAMDDVDEQQRQKPRGFLLGDEDQAFDPHELGLLVDPQDDDFPLEDVDIPPDQLLLQPRAPETIKKRFLELLLCCEANDVLIYREAINRLAEENKSSFGFDFQDLVAHQPILANLLIQSPREMIQLFEQQADELINLCYPNYHNISDKVNVRFHNVGNQVALMDLRHEHMDRFMSIHGVVVRRSAIYPKLQTAVYQCTRCNTHLPGVQQQLIGNTQLPHMRCPQPDCQSKSLRLSQVQSIFHNFQKLTIQEAPGTVQAGRIPRQVDVVVFDDLIDACTPGEEVEVIGYLHLIPDTHMNKQTGFPIYNTTLVANNILKKKSKSFSQNDGLSEFDIKDIHEISQWPNIQDILIRSIAPSIYGHYDIKTAIACSLFAGVAKELESKARLRGDINVLLVGDPGVAKSQFLKYTEHIGHRAVYTTGKGASAVGLTATVQRDKLTGEWTLEGGALVLADQGTCLIDEFDKMSDQDRTSIHEAMEQQTISVSKAGIVCTLKARCGVIAAANPIGGNYDNSMTFQEQVDLTEPILSRFDILCVVRDKIDRENDERLARFVTTSHMSADPEGKRGVDFEQHKQQQVDESQVTLTEMCERGFLTQQMLSKYILYARTHCQPSLSTVNNAQIISLYKSLRRAAGRSGGIQITPRHLESLLRISEALAKMRLAHRVENDDVNRAIQVMLDSFFQSQKLSVRQEFERQFSQYIFQVNDKHSLVLDTIKELVEAEHKTRRVLGKSYEEALAQPVEIKLDRLLARCVQLYGTIDGTAFLSSELFLNTREMSYDSQNGKIIYTYQE